ncbi:MAG TPA: sulfotransferase [Steroidobacteraceae bacterium]|jgi:tetratricopeptide (TPR) repeat protein|nr:sulfotransferase [Steroidobacteraceae bacterium]
MSASSEPVGTLETALAHTQRLMTSEPQLAVEQATEILKVTPGHPLATLLLGVAHRRSGDAAASQAVLEPLAQSQPNWAAAHYELGLTRGAQRDGEGAVAALRRAVSLKPEMPDAWRALGDHLTATGDASGADDAYAQHIKFSTHDPRLMEAATALCENRIPMAEQLLRTHLKQHPTDVTALRMLAEVAARLHRYPDAETLLERALELAPSFVPARHNYAVILHRQRKPGPAWKQAEKLTEADPLNPSYRTLKAAIASSIGDYDTALQLYSGVLAEYPQNARVWMSYGHALKTTNRQGECVQTYRKSIELAPHLGEAYWSLANLKTFRFTEADIAAMQAQLAKGKLTDDDRLQFHFALGKAFEDAGQFAESFKHYAEGNRIRRAGVGHDADWNSEQVRRAKALFTPEFFAARAGQGASAPDPIFVVGLPRSGSTLLEQILSSHPLVEGTMELADVVNIARELGAAHSRSASTYPQPIAALDADKLRALGERYLEQTRIYRKTDAPFFIDKLPNNFAHTGLIHLILPRAKIIDARRHPLGCCFSGYKQHFARGQHFTYSLNEIGRYYHDYVELMAHFDAVLPGCVHRVIYERMVADTEGEVRRVLDYCGLPFDERCLRFYENERAVRTASSEQVRRPIYREGVDHWRNYEPWLDPLKSALGSVLEQYPDVPEF